MTKQLTVDFFKIQMSDSPQTFSDLLTKVMVLPLNESRTLSGRGFPIRLQEVYINSNVVEGDMIRIRMDEMPLKTSMQGETEVLDLDEDEGIGEETAFMYNIPLNLLALQRNKYGTTPSTFAWYFKRKGDFDGTIDLDPVLREDAFEKLSRMKIIRKFNIRFAGLENADIFRNQDFSVGGIIELLDEFSAPNLGIEVSMGRKRGSLNFPQIQQAIRGLLRISSSHEKNVRKIEVEAQEDSSHSKEIFDFLGYRMLEKVPVNLNDDRRLPYSIRRNALSEAWYRRQNELRRMFTPIGK